MLAPVMSLAAPALPPTQRTATQAEARTIGAEPRSGFRRRANTVFLWSGPPQDRDWFLHRSAPRGGRSEKTAG